MSKPTALDRIKELDAEREKLLSEAKQSALATAEQALQDLNSLGFNYRLVEGGTSTPRVQRASTGTRRSGIREDVLSAIQEAGPDGIKPADIREKLGISSDDKSGSQSVANALSNLKSDKGGNKIALNNGAYFAT